MRKEDKIVYLKMFFLLLLLTPFIYTYCLLWYGNDFKAELVTSIVYLSLLALCILIYNYLEYGKFYPYHKEVKCCGQDFVFFRNVFGDEINKIREGDKIYRSWWRCPKCYRREKRETSH